MGFDAMLQQEMLLRGRSPPQGMMPYGPPPPGPFNSPHAMFPRGRPMSGKKVWNLQKISSWWCLLSWVTVLHGDGLCQSCVTTYRMSAPLAYTGMLLCCLATANICSRNFCGNIAPWSRLSCGTTYITWGKETARHMIPGMMRQYYIHCQE